MSEDSEHHRAIRSFVRRDSRITAGQKNALEKHWDQYGIDFDKNRLDLDTIFQRTAPRILDIGTGMGDSTIALAEQHPENDYLAVEVHKPGVGSLIHKAVKADLKNIRIISTDIHDVLQHQLENDSLDEIYIFFPDPWQKKRHHKRRLVNKAFLIKLLPTLKNHGRLFIATDWEDYAVQINEVCSTIDKLINLTGKNNYSPRPVWRPLTKFERRGINLQHAVWDFAFSIQYSTGTVRA